MSTVLVVDDDLDFLDALHQMLAAPGYSVLRASDGTSAIRLLEEHRELIDLAIIDLALPGVNGFEIIGAVSRRPNSVKVIATTAVYKDSQLEVAGALGAHAVIRKPRPGSPLPAADWLRTVEKLIGSPDSRKFARAAGAQPTDNCPEPANGKKSRQ
jgi:CheY-like chemotaxis protein